MDDDIQSKKTLVDMSWKTLHNFMATSITKTSSEPPVKKKMCDVSKRAAEAAARKREMEFYVPRKKPAPLRRNDPDARICNETFIFLTRMEHVLLMFKSYIPLSSCVCFRSVSRFLGVRLASVLGSNASSKCP